MAVHALSANFQYFFRRLNPSQTWVEKASSEYQSIKGLIENPFGPASELSPQCFLQGSYDRETAIYTINDVDIVALCSLWQPGGGGGIGRSWSRDEIFATIAAPLLADGRYREKVRYRSTSMCIKVDLGIKVEILPVVYKQGNSNAQVEPFRLYRPETRQWEDGYARYHQDALTQKNKATNGNFIPMIKVLKHLRSHHRLDAVSFHIECLLHSLPNNLFFGNPADYIPAVLSYIADTPAWEWFIRRITPPWEPNRNIFSPFEWPGENWANFHRHVVAWSATARVASMQSDKDLAITAWKDLLGDSFFPREVSS